VSPTTCSSARSCCRAGASSSTSSPAKLDIVFAPAPARPTRRSPVGPAGASRSRSPAWASSLTVRWQTVASRSTAVPRCWPRSRPTTHWAGGGSADTAERLDQEIYDSMVARLPRDRMALSPETNSSGHDGFGDSAYPVYVGFDTEDHQVVVDFLLLHLAGRRLRHTAATNGMTSVHQPDRRPPRQLEDRREPNQPALSPRHPVCRSGARSSGCGHFATARGLLSDMVCQSGDDQVTPRGNDHVCAESPSVKSGQKSVSVRGRSR
jgi:hypothetical protein